MSKCRYKKIDHPKYKYELTETYVDKIPFRFSRSLRLDYIKAEPYGGVIIRKGYRWDGASGPTIDTDDTMDGSLVHDVLYQLIREGELTMKDRKAADKCIRRMCIDDGMPKFRANYWYFFLRIAGRSSAK